VLPQPASRAFWLWPMAARQLEGLLQFAAMGAVQR
jgi:hypothetical protein